MTILHAHSDPDFTRHLRAVLTNANEQPHSVDIAVGYFYLSGFTLVADLLASRPGTVRLLIGRTDRPTRQEILAGYSPYETLAGDVKAPTRAQELAVQAETLANIGRNAAGQPQEDASEAGIKSLAALIAAGKIEVRAYLKERMHAKAYIGYTGISSVPGTAIIGSSNFSASGFTGNTELNYPVTHAGDVQEVQQWFERLWQEGEPISDAVVKQLQNSWPLATPSPYLIYLKILYELYGDTLGEETGPIKGPMELADFQQDAVAAGLAMLAKHNGCYIADVVGLGKTYIGAELLRRLVQQEPQAGDPLVLCPPRLAAMWERVCDQFGLENAEVVRMSSLTDGNYRSDRALRKTLRNAGPVLIDEAHNFRNNNQRRRVLLDFLKGSRPHKTILLSATPQNLAPRDLLRQLELFLDPEHHGLPGINGNLSQYFPDDPKEADAEQISEALRPVLLRRRRQDIERYYPNSSLGGKPIVFPTAELLNQNYSLDHAYSRAGGLNSIVNLLKSHQASRYRPAHYLTEAARFKPEYRQMQNPAYSLPALIRVLLFKRLESSIPAFRSTLNNLINSNRAFRDGLLQGVLSQDDGSNDADEAFAELDETELSAEYLSIKGKTYAAQDFHVKEWLDNLDADYAALQAIYDKIKDLTPADDAKLRQLKSFITTPGINTEKLLIFTESIVTAQYLCDELRAVPELKDAVDLLTGDDSRRAGQDKMSRFSPVSNGQPNLPESEQIRIMIATDVLAEGQNLQDCGRALNYDLHWNPVKLIQRYGRIDRIATEHQTIHLHNMLPDIGVEEQIHLAERLSGRVQSFHNLLGLDNAVLQETERVNQESIYAIYDGEMPEPEDVLDSIAMAQETNALLNRIRREQTELWNQLLNMPDGLRAACAADNLPNLPADTTLALLVNNDTKQGCRVEANLTVRPLSHAETARSAQCEPATPATVLPPNLNGRITAAIAACGQPQETDQLAPIQPAPSSANDRYIARELRQLSLDQRAGGELRRLEQLRIAFTGQLPTSVSDRISQLRRDRISGTALQNALAELQAQLPKAAPTQISSREPAAPSGLRALCSISAT